jgi:hypothetical protein
VPSSISAAVQLALVLASAPYTPSLCAAAPLAHPGTQHITHQLYSVLNLLAGMVALPVAPPPVPQSPATECATLVTWLRLGLALLAPLLYEAVSEARLWRLHQVQRRHAGLAPEPGGLLAAVYRAAWWLAWEDGGVQMGVLCWLLLALSWDWSAVLLVRGSVA